MTEVDRAVETSGCRLEGVVDLVSEGLFGASFLGVNINMQITTCCLDVVSVFTAESCQVGFLRVKVVSCGLSGEIWASP